MPPTTERRAKPRDPITLKVRFRTLDTVGAVTGNGETVNFSSQGILVAARLPSQLGLGARLETIVDWPIRLHGKTAIELVTTGTVVRSSEEGFAVLLAKYKFRPIQA
jgi:hypothetical protein